VFLVDTNILLDIFTDDATWRSWSEQAGRNALVAGIVGINPIVYAETSLAFADTSTLDRHLDTRRQRDRNLSYSRHAAS